MTVTQAQAAWYQANPDVPYIADTKTWFIWWNSWWQAHGGWPLISLVAQTYPTDAQIMQAFGYIAGAGIPPDVLSTGTVTAQELTNAANALSPSGIAASNQATVNAEIAANQMAVSPDQTIFTLGTTQPVSNGTGSTTLNNGTSFGNQAVTPTVATSSTGLIFGLPEQTVLIIGGAAALLLILLMRSGGKASPSAHHAK